jgi:glycosyltransferase involved in cell wall biosynthesis
MSCHVLSNYPLSTSYKANLEQQIGFVPNYLTVPEVRNRAVLDIVRFLRTLRGDVLIVALEDENSHAILPILEMIAALTRVKRIAVVLPNGKRKPFLRWQSLESFLSFIRASSRCFASIRACDRELSALLSYDRISPERVTSDRIVYLNANLWFGVKAGGSVGHISGVVNGFLKLGRKVKFISAGSRLMVRDEAEYVQLNAPRGYGLPYDGNYYAFHRYVTRFADGLLRDQPAFLYQRMSIANYSAVLLSRKYRVPLVLEYNGSEVWVARNWGRPLSHPEIAAKAEEACLRHAHTVVTVSDVLRDELITRGVPTDRIVSYPNCIDEDIFDPGRFSDREVQAIRARYGISPDATVISFLGTFGQWHGVEIMGEAIRLLAAEVRNLLEETKTHFLIIGDGIRMSKLQEILSDDRCNGLYSLPGLVRQEEAPLHLAAADILLSPHIPNSDGTRFFGSPTKLFEYMAMSRAIVASDLDQIGEVLKNSLHSHELPTADPSESENRLAILCPPGNPRQLANAIRFLIKNEAWRRVLGQNARREALDRYTWRDHVETIENRLKALGLIGN